MLRNLFAGKVVIVTGSGNGIGKAIAAQFSSSGASLVLVDKDGDGLEATKKECQHNSSLNLEPKVIVADLSLDLDIERVVNRTVEWFNRIDVVVNNAAIVVLTSIQKTTFMKDFDDVLGVNTRAPLFLIHLAAPHLIQSKGCVVNVSSVASTRPFPGTTPHNVSKAALSMVTKSLAVELGALGVRVNEVNPGFVETRIMQRNSDLADERNDALMRGLAAATPLKRLSRPEEIANGVCFLASNSASMINGHSLVIDGGHICSLIQNPSH